MRRGSDHSVFSALLARMWRSVRTLTCSQRGAARHIPGALTHKPQRFQTEFQKTPPKKACVEERLLKNACHEKKNKNMRRWGKTCISTSNSRTVSPCVPPEPRQHSMADKVDLGFWEGRTHRLGLPCSLQRQQPAHAVQRGKRHEPARCPR